MQVNAAVAEPATLKESELPSLPYRGYILFMTMLVGALSVFDKRILSMLITPIRHEFDLNDRQLGLLMGMAFAVVYVFACIPAARLADRWSRRNVVALAVAAWSIMTAVCGLAQSFWQLFLARIGVGLGEAGGSAPIQALISDNFPQRQRGTALSIYLIGSSIGIGAGTAFGGWALEAFDWRWAFFLAGLPGLIVAPLFFLTIPNSRAGLADGVTRSFDQRPFLETLKVLLSIRTIPLMLSAATLNSLLAMGLNDWVPQLLERSHQLAPLEFGAKLGIAMSLGSIIGHIVGGPLADFQSRRDYRWHLWQPAITCILGACLAAVAYTGPAAWVYPLIGLQLMLSGLFAAPMILILTTLAPVWARATSAALAMFTINLVGLGMGPWLIGTLSDILRPAFGEESLRMAMLCALVLAIPVAILFLLASRHYRADLEAARLRLGAEKEA